MEYEYKEKKRSWFLDCRCLYDVYSKPEKD